MRIHEGFSPNNVCDAVGGGPCSGDHLYNCRRCGTLFTVNDSTITRYRGKVLGSIYWPFCSEVCIVEAAADHDVIGAKVLERIDI